MAQLPLRGHNFHFIIVGHLRTGKQTAPLYEYGDLETSWPIDVYCALCIIDACQPVS